MKTLRVLKFELAFVMCLKYLSVFALSGVLSVFNIANAESVMVFEKGQKVELGSITDDGVMGGLSKGQLTRSEDGAAKFFGMLSLDNNGGFSSWTMNREQRDLSAWKGIALKVKGDGRSYKLRLQTDETYRFSRVSFQEEFPTKSGEWTTVKVAFADLQAGWRGRTLDRVFDPAEVSQIGIILADKKEGAFALEVKEVSLWK